MLHLVVLGQMMWAWVETAKMHVFFQPLSKTQDSFVDWIGATLSWSHGDGDGRGRPVIDGGSRGAVGVATQVAGASCVDVEETDTYA